ncbi:metallophosphoesterase family protein [Natronospora cellulosivora (SeqCode)]
MKIGVLSDTHIPTKTKKIPDIVFEKFANVDLIIHAGDIADKEVINTLETCAPVRAVSGNIDPPELKRNLPLHLEIELEGYKIAVTHGHSIRGHLMNKLSYVFPDADLIIFGHTHKPCNKLIQGQLHFNPGSPTDRRMQKKHSIGIIELGKEIVSEIIEF